MNVAQISYFYRPARGGQDVYVDSLLRVLASAGHAGTVYHASRRHWPGLRSYPTLPVLGRFFPQANLHLFNWQLRRFARRHLCAADVIVAHYAFFARPVWDLPDRVIVLSHGIEWYADSGRRHDRLCEEVARAALERFTTVANDTAYYRHFGLAAAPAEGFFRELAPGRWFIPNAVDTDRFRPSGRARRPVVLVPRQICHDRGIDLAIAAFQRFAARRDGYELHVVGGPTRGAYFRSCARLARDLGVASRVRFLGYVPHAGMPAVYGSARVTLIPTRRREGTSLSALESMACGTPTVSTEAGGLRDLPTLKAAATAEGLADGLAEAAERGDRLGAEQQAAVARDFPFRRWAEAWNAVLAPFAARRR
jgi:glycosyltransferase involved in cell wall biosynthesis